MHLRKVRPAEEEYRESRFRSNSITFVMGECGIAKDII